MSHISRDAYASCVLQPQFQHLHCKHHRNSRRGLRTLRMARQTGRKPCGIALPPRRLKIEFLLETKHLMCRVPTSRMNKSLPGPAIAINVSWESFIDANISEIMKHVIIECDARFYSTSYIYT